LVEPYDLSVTSYHFDLYRLGDPEELEYIGIRDYFSGPSLSLIEWPSRGLGMLPEADMLINIEVEGSGRRIAFNANTQYGQACVAQLQAMICDLGIPKN
jgi:tRNA threonylcarbamoyladenosine biosynthesis protein TsaE